MKEENGYVKVKHYDFGDMVFKPKPSTKEILVKYGMTEEQYNLVCIELCSQLNK